MNHQTPLRSGPLSSDRQDSECGVHKALRAGELPNYIRRGSRPARIVPELPQYHAGKEKNYVQDDPTRCVCKGALHYVRFM